MAHIASELSDVVIFLFAGNPLQPIGTAFVVGFPVPGKDDVAVPLIVTAKHVVADHPHILGRFSTQTGTNTAFVRYDVQKMRTEGDYWEHPDDGVDISVFRSLHYDETKYKVFPRNLIATLEVVKTEEIAQGDRVVFPALLVNFVGSAKNYPVLRNGAIALMPEEKVPMQYLIGSRVVRTQQEVLLLDATSIPGASGAPIFLWPGPRNKGNTLMLGGGSPYLLGVMHGFYPAAPRELVEVHTAGSTQMYAENSGIAIAFPSWRLHEILEREDLRKRIEDVVGSDPPTIAPNAA